MIRCERLGIVSCFLLRHSKRRRDRSFANDDASARDDEILMDFTFILIEVNDYASAITRLEKKKKKKEKDGEFGDNFDHDDEKK